MKTSFNSKYIDDDHIDFYKKSTTNGNRFQIALIDQLLRIKHCMYSNEETALAHEIATALNDQKAIGQHLKYAKLYSHKALRETLQKVMNIPNNKIYSSRAAYFVSLVKQLKYHDNSGY